MAELYAMARKKSTLVSKQRRQEKIFRVRFSNLDQTEEDIYLKYRLSSQIISDIIEKLSLVLSMDHPSICTDTMGLI